MKRVRIAELKRQLSRHLRSVEAGDEIVVTDRDRPIARIVPIRREAADFLRPAEVSVASVRRRRVRPARWAISSLELLLEDRRRR
jgi:prevent-host-death family protein